MPVAHFHQNDVGILSGVKIDLLVNIGLAAKWIILQFFLKHISANFLHSCNS